MLSFLLTMADEQYRERIERLSAQRTFPCVNKCTENRPLCY